MRKIFVLIILLFFGLNPSEACTRAVYKGKNGIVVTGRSMDFAMPIPANWWVLPRGIERNGEVGTSSITWIAKYGSIATSSWDISTSDGVNEAGLAAHMLWLGESKYPTFKKDGEIKGISVSLWAQYALDNFSSVAEAVEVFKKEEFVIVSDYIPGTKKYTTVHLSLTDKNGDSAILEYVEGKLQIHHSADYQICTNSPIYQEQLALNKYWEQISGFVMLPGTNRAADRFARASFYMQALPKVESAQLAVASTFSVMRAVSVPYGLRDGESLEISSTQWRTVFDHQNLTYYFESVLTPSTFWVDLKKIDFSSKTLVRMLPIDENQIYNGEVSKLFKKAKPFEFLGL